MAAFDIQGRDALTSTASGGMFGGGDTVFSPSFLSPFAVGDGATATATSGADRALIWAVVGAAVVAVGVAVYVSRRK